MAAKTPEPVERLEGVVDSVTAPNTLSGWVLNRDRPCGGGEIAVTVWIGQRVIGEGAVSFERRDVMDVDGYRAGFRIECIEALPDEALAFGTLLVEARDNRMAVGRLEIWEPVRGQALARILRASPPLGEIGVGAILRVLTRDASLDGAKRQSLSSVYDQHFASTQPPEPSIPVGVNNWEDQQLLLRFESLGHKCTFGTLQRAVGAEPLGLLRFTGIGVDELITALHDRMRGVGDPVFTRVEPDGAGEYFCYDSRYHMASHTFVFEGDVQFDEFFSQQCKRLSYLARNLIEDIEDGAKILVFYEAPYDSSDSKMLKLLDAVRSIGSSRLLYVRSAGDGAPAGTVLQRQNGLIIGYVADAEGDWVNPGHPARESWLAVCREVTRIFADEPAKSSQ